MSQINPDQTTAASPTGTKGLQRSLAREIGWVLALKMAALIALYLLCFAPSDRTAPTPDRVASALMGPPPGPAGR